RGGAADVRYSGRGGASLIGNACYESLDQRRGGITMRLLKFGCVLLTGFVLTAGAQAQVPPAAVVQPSAADAKLRKLYDGYAAWDAKESEFFQDARGETKP